MKRKVSWILIITIILTSLNAQLFKKPIEVRAAYGDILFWNKNDIMDDKLNITENKAEEGKILLELDAEEFGHYELSYFLEDSRKTIIEFERISNALNIVYRVEEQDGTKITKNLVNKYYMEMNYEKEVPIWETISDKTVSKGNLEFTINETASNKYPGVAFKIEDGNKEVIIKWDYQTEKIYYLIGGYKSGNIMPVSFKNSSGDIEETKILNGLEEFIIEPTHLEKNGTVNENKKLLVHPDGSEPGTSPGLKVSFKQPKEFNTSSWSYDVSTGLSNINAIVQLKDISSNSYLNLEFPLSNSSGDVTNNSVNVGKYSYDSDTYNIDIVKDKTGLANPDYLIQWDDLASGKIYNSSIVFQKPLDGSMDEFEFKEYIPEGYFAYTYMEFTIDRANMTEANLIITPYDVNLDEEIEYTILYSKAEKEELDKKNDLWVRHYYNSAEDGDEIYIPVPFNSESDKDVYQIIVNFSGVDLRSQVLRYKAIDDKNIPLTTPRIEDIENLYVVPPEDETSEEPSKVQFDLIWQAPDSKEILDKLLKDTDDRIYYELLINDIPTDDEDNPFQTIKVFEVYKEDDKYKIKDHYDKATPSDDLNYEDGYNEDDELFKIENISIREDDEWVKIINIEEENYDIPPEGSLTENYDVEFPGVYYIRIKAVTKIDGEVGVSNNSLPVSLPLSMTTIDVPIPDNLSYDPIYDSVSEPTSVGIKLNWDPVQTEIYENYMLLPVNKSIDNIDYHIYMSMNKEELLELDLSNIYEPDAAAIIDGNLTLDADTMDNLKNDKIIHFTKNSEKDIRATQISSIMGLEENENYYIRIIALLNIDDSGTVEPRPSEPSPILSVTAPIIPKEPNEGEIKPLAVNDLEVSFLNDDGLQGNLTWEFPEEITIEENEYGFEILSIEDRSLPTSLFSSDVTIKEILDSDYFDDDELEAWRIYREESGDLVLKKYSHETNIWEEQDSSLFSINENKASMIDSHNSPNVVNYYYVRTIDFTSQSGDDEITVKAASAWQVDTLTTAPISAPINLTVIYDSDYSYDEKTESIIRFDAPIPYDSDLETDYVMEIFVKGEEDSDYTSTKYDTELLERNEDGPLGYTRLLYRISDLDPGKSYSIRVRIEDRTKELERQHDDTWGYPKSPYSERITIRTEFDQDSYDKEIIYQEYLDYFDSLIEELKRKPYFLVKDNSKTHTVKYRDEYSQGELSVNKNGVYELYTTESETQDFYLPADFIEKANDYNVTIQIAYNNQEISIRPKSLGINITDEIEHIIDEINEYGSDLSDYFIQISVNIDDYSSKILSKNPLSDLIDLEINVIGSEESEEDIDKMMLDELENIISNKRVDLAFELEDELENGALEEELIEVVEKAFENVVDEHMEEVEEILDDYFEENIRIDEVDKNMQIKITPYEKGTSASAYYKENGNWEKSESFYYNNSYLMDIKELSSYILLPEGANYSNITPIYTNEEIDVISKYNLSDIFSSMQIELSEGSFYQYRLMEVLATVLGNNTGNFSENKNYLKEMGIDLPSSNEYGIVSAEEALYLCTQVYSIKQNVNLKAIQITDFNMIEDIYDVDPKFRETLLVGANIGLFELDNGFLYPDEDFSIEKLIDILTKIDQGITW